LRCGRCGNENAESNRFCGMCGAPLQGKDQPGAQAHASAATSAKAEPRAAASAEVKADAGSSSGPVITGPSFLGLGTPAGGTGSGRGGTHGDRHGDAARDALRPSSSVDYLLEDVDEPRRGWGKLILLVLALALAVGFGYLHWKRGGFDWLSAGEKKPSAATAQAPEATPSGADSAAKPTSAASGTAPQAGTNPDGMAAGMGAATPAESGSPQMSAAQTSAQAAPAQSGAAQSVTQQGADEQSAPPSSANNSSAAANGSQAADSESDKQSIPAEAPPKPVTRKPAAAKPAGAKPAAAKAGDSVTQAERYIYGRGVPQDCDRGLRLLKPAAESNTQAMISMGVMYTTGTCTPRDLPTAYRWFALALHKEPDNQALQDDLQKLWGQMTPPERQLAIK